jgi:hypothetical protein
MTAPARKTTTTTAAPKAPEPSPPEGPTPAEIERIVDDLESFINRALRDSTKTYEVISNRTFEVLFDGDVEAALAPMNGSPKYAALAARADKSLQIDGGSLSRMVRIGALNHHLNEGKWRGLAWSHKAELLPLLGREMDLEQLRKGVTYASKPGVGRGAIRSWVGAQRQKDASVNREEKLTALKARQMLGIGAHLQKVGARRLLADRIRRLDAEMRRDWRGALALSIKNLTRLQEELDDDAQD